MRVTLVGLADAVKALAQRLKQVLQTIDSLLNLENMPATVPENLDQWSRAAAKKMTTVAPSVREYILLECGAISVELGKLNEVEKDQTVLYELLYTVC